MLRSVRSCWSARGFALLALVVGYDLLAKPIRLRSGTLDPEAGPRGSAVIPENRAGLYLVQFRGPLDGGARSALRNVGIELLRSVPEDTYVVRLEPREVGLVQTLPFVEWVGEYAAEHKVHARLHGYIQRNRAGELASVSVLVRPKATAAETRETEGAFQSLKQKSLATFGTILRGKVSGARLANLAKSSAVLWIEPGPEFKLVDEVASKIVAGDGGLNVTIAQSAGFDGRGVTVAVADSGLHNGDVATMHPDLFGRVTAFFYYGNLTDAADEHSHGTHCAGIVAGNGATGETDDFGALYGLGVAPQAMLIAQRIFDGEGGYEAPPSFETLTRDAVRAGADIGSNSWGDDTQGRYDLSAAEFDGLVRDADAFAPGDQSYILEFSAGNAGPGAQTMDSPAVAKNVIATGAVQNSRPEFELYGDGPDTLADFSSRGPCEDGRIKPDVVAPGTWIASLQSASAGDESAWSPISANYQYQGGTSQAGPHVSGAAAVLVQYFRQVYGMARPSPALVKATLINSAVDMDDEVETDPAPNMDEGWGRVDLTSVVLGERRFDFLDQTVVLSVNQVFEKRVLIASSLEPLKITLTYTDVPGFPAAIPALVNDLDLEVIAPDGTLFRGNQFLDGESVPNASMADNINNVEGVQRFEPMAGEYIVRVRARRVMEDARVDTDPVDQDFALVISGDIPLPGVGVLLMDRPAYTVPAAINLRLFDSDLGPASIANVQIRSTTESSPETVTMRAVTSGSYTGSIVTVVGVAAGDRVLQVHHGDLIEATYMDASGGTRTASARADLFPPVITTVRVTNEFGRTIIEWQTDERANSIVRYGTNSSLAFAATNSAFVLDHRVELRGLRASQTYFFAVISADEAGNRATNNNAGALFSFVPVAAAPVLLVNAYVEDTETAPLPLSGYTNALNQTGVAYEVWDVGTRGSPALEDLRPFQAVIWRISDSPYVDTSLTSTEQAAIQNYLNEGGGFFMSSMELLTRLGDVPFRRNVLHVQQFLQNPDPFSTCSDCDEDFMVPTIRGLSSDPMTAGILADLDYSAFPILDFGFFQFGPDFSDTFTPSTNATAILFEHSSGKPCAMKSPRAGQDSLGRVVFMSFPIDAVPLSGSAPNNRAVLFRNILQFLAPGASGSGSVVFDRGAYTLPDIATVEVADSDLAGVGQATVNVYSQSFSNRVSIVAQETVRAGVFRAAVAVAPVSEAAGPGKIRTRHGDSIFAEYLDGSVMVRASALVDTQLPQILNVLVEPDYDSAFASWDTSEATDTLVQYGESTFLGRTAYDPQLGESHQILLTGLTPDRQYYYQVVSRDLAGNVTVDDNGGQLYTFRTLTPIRPPWQDNLESGANGWTVLDGDDSETSWTLGNPNNGWETEANSPVTAWGSNLNGTQSGYAATFLVSPAIDLTGGNQATLRFFHSYDFFASEEDIILDGQLMIVTNTATAPILLREYSEVAANWEEEQVDLTPYLGRVVFLVWYYEFLSFDTISRAGWLVDDVSVTMNTVVPVTVRVTNNIAQGNFVLSGPSVSRTGQGMLNLYTNLLPGQYTVTFGQVQFYQTPTTQTQTLTGGGSGVFQGLYTFADANNNGMSDAWEQAYFGSVSPTRTRTTDTDGDGATDYQEFVAGTSPTATTSYLKVTTPELIGPNVRLRWPSAAGHEYRVEGSANGTAWTPVTDWIRAKASSTTATLPVQGPPAPFLFRVEVRP